MTDISKIKQRIAVINAESKRLNNERNMNLGKLETLNNQLETQLAEYNKKYGVTLTVETLQSEMEKVTADIEKQSADIEAILTAIKDGDYTKANKLAGQEEPVNNTEVSSPNVPVEEVSSPISEPVEEVASPIAPVSEPETVSEPPKMEEPTMPPMGMPVAPPPVVSSPEEVASPISEPETQASNNLGDNVTSFNAILGGTAFDVD